MKLKFWGTRGSIAVPESETLRYGGNTTCLEVQIPGVPPAIIDAGTGIRRLGIQLADRPESEEIVLMVTHLHWDHVMGFLFFAPAFIPGKKIHVTGWPKAVQGLKSIFDTRQGDGHFPICFEQLPAHVQTCPKRRVPEFNLGEVTIRSTPLNHPQGAIGYKFTEGDESLVFITDNELGGPGPLEMDDFVRFIDGAGILIHDAQYLPEEMEARRGFGHSDWATVVQLALKAGVEELILTHHDPNRTDDQVDELVGRAQDAAGGGIKVQGAREGMVVEI